MDFEEAARRVHLNRSVAFFGAGFSRDAKNHNDKPLSASADLAKTLSEAAGEDEVLPLRLASQVYEDKKCEPSIRDVIRNFYRASKITDAQLHIASLPWMQIYTTNYDDVIEEGRREWGRSVDSVTVLDRPRDYAGSQCIVHLNGFVERITESDWQSSFALTDRQYASDILSQSGWPERFRSDAAYADAIFFFGYSLYDLDIARLLYQDPSLRDKTFFVIGKSADRATQLTVAPYGSAILRDVDEVHKLFPKDDDPSAARPAPYLASLQEQKFTVSNASPSRDDVANFLVKGDASPDLVVRDLVNATHDYYVPRTQLSEAANALGRGPMRLLFHSRLGEGKTCGLIEFSHYCLAEGRRVLLFNGDPDGLPHDIDYIASLGSAEQTKLVVIFERSFSYTRQIKYLIERFPLVSVVLTTRSAALQTRIGDLEDAFGEDFEVHTLGTLDDDEARDLDDILFANGLWGDRQGASTRERLDYIARSCHSDLTTILIHVCRSSDIFKRVAREFANLDGQPSEIKRSILAALCAAYAGVRYQVAQLCEVVQSDLFKYGTYQANEIIREFVDFDRQRITVRSPAFAQSILKTIIPDHVILDEVPTLIARLHRQLYTLLSTRAMA